MLLGHVERVEQVPRVLDLVTVDDAIAEPDEDVLDLAADLRQEVKVTARRRLTWQGDVERLRRRRALLLLGREAALPLFHRGLELLAERVQRDAPLAVAHLAESELELALSPQEANARLVQLRLRLRGGDGCKRLALECVGVHGGDCSGFSLLMLLLSGDVGTVSPRPERWRNAALARRPGLEPGPRKPMRAGRHS